MLVCAATCKYLEFNRHSQNICKICNFDYQICCPTTAGPALPVVPVTPKPKPPPVTRSDNPHLLSIDEGCGFSNFTSKRIVGGEPAEKGSLFKQFYKICLVISHHMFSNIDYVF